jgi:hypothetical protein
MEWDPFVWSAMSRDWDGADPQACNRGPSGCDAWLLQAAYEVMASESYCSLCGARLGRRVRLVSSPQPSTSVSLASFAARCGGWRRQRQRAEVVEASGDLVLGPFTATRQRAQP